MKHYYAIMPTSSGPPKWSLTNCRIEKADSAAEACEAAFGRSSMRDELNRGHWLAKNLGTRAETVRSDKQRTRLLEDTNDWFDPYAPGVGTTKK